MFKFFRRFLIKLGLLKIDISVAFISCSFNSKIYVLHQTRNGVWVFADEYDRLYLLDKELWDEEGDPLIEKRNWYQANFEFNVKRLHNVIVPETFICNNLDELLKTLDD